jgi:hypothetical protein
MASFAKDIRPLFTDEDVEHMLDFDLDMGSYDSVKENAENIYERVADGSMPPGAPWPDAIIARFRQWIDEGCPA